MSVGSPLWLVGGGKGEGQVGFSVCGPSETACHGLTGTLIRQSRRSLWTSLDFRLMIEDVEPE